MKRKSISVRLEPKIFIGQYESVIIGSETGAELEEGDDEAECRRQLADEIRDFIAEEFANHWKSSK